MFFPRDVPWGGNRPPTPLRRVRGVVPALGFAFLPLTATSPATDLKVAANTIENAHYRVQVDPLTGAVREWLDKDLGHDFAGSYRGWGIGQYVYEWVDSPLGRQELFAGDFSHEDFGTWAADSPFRHAATEQVSVQPHAPPRAGYPRTGVARSRARAVSPSWSSSRTQVSR